jgi:acyl-CoA thioesterase-2
VIAQALVAAQSTVDADRPAHSLHAYFLRGASEDFPIEFAVDRVFDGGSFSNRRLTATQQGKTVFACSVSFQRPEEGFAHQSAVMPDVPEPDALESEHVLLARHWDEIAPNAPPIMLRPRAIEVRAVDPSDLLERSPVEPVQQIWFRVRAPLPDDPLLHRAILAYWSDMRLMATSLMPHPLSFARGDVRGASLDHALWFHADARVDEWLLYSMESPWTGGGRGLNHGQIFARDGTLVASVAQEGMFRPAR